MLAYVPKKMHGMYGFKDLEMHCCRKRDLVESIGVIEALSRHGGGGNVGGGIFELGAC